MLRSIWVLSNHLLGRGRGASWRRQVRVNPATREALDEGRPLLYAFLHAQREMFVSHPSPRPLLLLFGPEVSDTDAERARLSGFHFVRCRPGATAEGIRELTDRVLYGSHAALAVDHPGSTPGEVRPGILHLARDTEGAVIPLMAFIRRAGGWVPADSTAPPFGRLLTLEGPPLFVEEEADDDRLAELRALLQERFDDLRHPPGDLPLE